jgi:antitoxin PrlF
MSQRRMTRKGQVTIPMRLRQLLGLTPGDAVELELNAAGELVLRKAPAPKPSPRRRGAQLRSRAAELRSLLRGLD